MVPYLDTIGLANFDTIGLTNCDTIGLANCDTIGVLDHLLVIFYSIVSHPM